MLFFGKDYGISFVWRRAFISVYACLFLNSFLDSKRLGASFIDFSLAYFERYFTACSRTFQYSSRSKVKISSLIFGSSALIVVK